MNRPRILVACLALGFLAGCAEATALRETGVAYRREMNDRQAKFALAAVCDISMGAFYRLSNAEQELVGRHCADGERVLEAKEPEDVKPVPVVIVPKPPVIAPVVPPPATGGIVDPDDAPFG